MKPRVALIIPAGGLGTRLGSKVPKPLMLLGSKPLLIQTLRSLMQGHPYSSVIMPVSAGIEDKVRNCLKREGLRHVIVTKGGRTRAESVYKAFGLIKPTDDLIAVHDVARPFVTKNIIRETIRVAARKGSALAVESVSSTVKESKAKSKQVFRTLSRDRIFLAQTPQVFRRNRLAGSYEKLGSRAFGFTDEASLVEANGHKVYMVESPKTNIKITTKEDLAMAKVLIRRKLN